MNFVDCGLATRGLHIFVEQLLGWRGITAFCLSRPGRRFHPMRFSRVASRIFSHYGRNGGGMGTPAMTGVAGYFAMAIEIILVDGEHHLHHFSRGLLWLLVVFVESILNVAELALNS